MADSTILLVNLLWASVVVGVLVAIFLELRTRRIRIKYWSNLSDLEARVNLLDQVLLPELSKDHKFIRGELEKLKAIPSKPPRL